jgi:hypothetical protein
MVVGGQRQYRRVTAQPTDPVPSPEELDAPEATGRTGQLTDQEARELLGIPDRRGDEGTQPPHVSVCRTRQRGLREWGL